MASGPLLFLPGSNLIPLTPTVDGSMRSRQMAKLGHFRCGTIVKGVRFQALPETKEHVMGYSLRSRHTDGHGGYGRRVHLCKQRMAAH